MTNHLEVLRGLSREMNAQIEELQVKIERIREVPVYPLSDGVQAELRECLPPSTARDLAAKIYESRASLSATMRMLFTEGQALERAINKACLQTDPEGRR